MCIDGDVICSSPGEEAVEGVLEVGIFRVGVADGRGDGGVIYVLPTILGVQECVVDDEEEVYWTLKHPAHEKQEVGHFSLHTHGLAASGEKIS